MAESTRERPVVAWAIESGRKWHGWDRHELARQLGEATDSPWNYNQVRRLETGERGVDVDLLDALSRVLDLPVSHFMRGPRREGDGTSGGSTGR